MMVLITGGSGSGKSAFAERVACALAARDARGDAHARAENGGRTRGVADGSAPAGAPASHGAAGRSRAGSLVYLATMEDIVNPNGTRPAAARIARHRAQRAGRGFETVECPRNLGDLEFSGDETVLLEDAGNALANELFAPGVPFAPLRAAARSEDGIAHVARTCRNLVVVTNEVGADMLCASAETRAYVRALGRLSCRMAARADVVCEVAAGLPNVLRGASELADLLSGAQGAAACDGTPCAAGAGGGLGAAAPHAGASRDGSCGDIRADSHPGDAEGFR